MVFFPPPVFSLWSPVSVVALTLNFSLIRVVNLKDHSSHRDLINRMGDNVSLLPVNAHHVLNLSARISEHFCFKTNLTINTNKLSINMS